MKYTYCRYGHARLTGLAECTRCTNFTTHTTAINEERLTDAINTSPDAPAEPRGRQGGDMVGGETADGGIQGRVRTAKGSSRVVADKTPNRRSRESYNAYMRDYMARRRAK